MKRVIERDVKNTIHYKNSIDTISVDEIEDFHNIGLEGEPGDRYWIVKESANSYCTTYIGDSSSYGRKKYESREGLVKYYLKNEFKVYLFEGQEQLTKWLKEK